MHDPVHEETFHGHQIKIYHDEDTESPRDWSTFASMICWHRRYTLGDDHSFHEPRDFLCDLAECSGETELSYDRLMGLAARRAVILPLFLYDHSGLAMNTVGFHCPWDSGQVGYIYVRLEDVRKEFGLTRISSKARLRAEDLLRSEVATFNDYLGGRIYGFTVEKDGEEIDACWGFLGGYEDYCLIEARSAVPRPVFQPATESPGTSATLA